MLARSVRLALLLMALALVPATAAQAATIWTQVPTGTTQTIAAISSPSSSEVLFATTGGQIFRLSGGSFVPATLSTPNLTGFTDIAMSSDGTKGVAVGPSGVIYHSIDSGTTWSKNAAITEPAGSCPNPGPTTPTLTDNLFSVQFADAATVYITGAHDDVLKSFNSGALFAEVNKSALAGGSCKVSPSEDFGDTAWLDANNGYLLSTYFGDTFLTTDGFVSNLGPRKGEALNAFGRPNALAVAPNDPQHLWAVEGFASCGSLCLQTSTDGGTNWTAPQRDITPVNLRDVSTAGATVIAVGDGGDIYTSPDGSHFFRQVSGGFPTNDWHAVAVLNTTTAYVGGANGTLLVSTTANQTPDNTAPTGSITGPTRLATGQFGTFTAHVTDNPGGSGVDQTSYVWSTAGLPDQTGHPTATFAFSTTGTHTISVAFKDLAGNANTAIFTVNVSQLGPTGSSPTTTKTGGAKVTIFKHVTVKGRKGRFIPVTLSTKKPRKFAITLLSVSKKHPKTFAKLTVTIAKGTKTVHLAIPNKVKSGSYRLIVKVFTTGKRSHQTGKSVKQVFVLT
jgi:photosystem II stability/assembly factor-like uncharacterized protein